MIIAEPFEVAVSGDIVTYIELEEGEFAEVLEHGIIENKDGTRHIAPTPQVIRVVKEVNA